MAKMAEKWDPGLTPSHGHTNVTTIYRATWGLAEEIDPKFQGAQLPSQPSLGMFHFLFAGVFDFVMMGKIHPDSVDSV